MIMDKKWMKILMDILKMDILTWKNFDWANVTLSIYSTIMIDFESVIPGKSEAKKKIMCDKYLWYA